MSLIIPMLVEAYLSDGIDAETKRVPQVSPDYSAALFQSFLGSKNTPLPVDSKMPPLKRGVHLHFIIPDALKKADEDGRYPSVPDRYIVTRIITSQEPAEIRQWMVDSSFITTDDRYAGSVSIPMFTDSSAVKFRYCGRSYDITSPPAKQGEHLACLTALGGGDPLFAAYYPNCHSIFGFRDDMAGVAEGARVCYAVTGYYREEKTDAFHNIKTAEQFLDKLKELGLSVDQKGAVCSQSCLFGVVEGITWTNGTITDQIPTGNVDAAVGKTSAEALSAAVERRIKPAGEAFQRFFTAMQYSEVDNIYRIDGAHLLDDEILLRQYQRLESGAGMYALTGSDEENDAAAEEFAEITNAQIHLGRELRSCESQKQRLFCLWEQYMILYENDDSPKEPSREAMLEEITRTALQIAKAKADITKEEAAIKKKAAKGMEHTGDDPFYLPKEPVLLLSGDGIKRTYAFGENGRYESNGTLLCQTTPVRCGIEQAEILKMFPVRKTEWEEYEQLFIQAVLLCSEPRGILEKSFGPLAITGTVSPLAVNKEPGSFVSLFMDWKMLFYPLRTSADKEKDNTLTRCRFDYGDTDFTTTDPVGQRGITYTGRNVLTPHAVINLKQRLLDWLTLHDDDEDAKKAAKLLDALPVVSQNLGGLNEQFTAQRQAYQFPIMGNGGDEAQVRLVEEHCPQMRTSVLTDYPLFPLRGGYFRLSQLQIVGTFGQIQQIYAPSCAEMPDTLYGETVKSAVPGFGYLNPAFTRPSRINFRWLWKDGMYSSQAKKTSPVEGFLVPELLNGRFLIYDAEGQALGELKEVLRNNETQIRWVSAPGLPADLDSVPMSAVLRKFLAVLSARTEAFTGLKEVVDKVLEKTLPDPARGAIWGKTLALSKAEASFEFHGEPDFTKDFDEFAGYNTLGAKDIKVPLAFGDVNRSEDGFAAAFTSSDFKYMYPPFGMEGTDKGGFIRYGEMPGISLSDGKQKLYLLAEATASITLQTGLHPVTSLKLLPAHMETVKELVLQTEFYPVITPEGTAQIPPARSIDMGNGECGVFQVRREDGIEYWEVKEPDRALRDTVICEGRYTVRHKKEGRSSDEQQC